MSLLSHRRWWLVQAKAWLIYHLAGNRGGANNGMEKTKDAQYYGQCSAVMSRDERVLTGCEGRGSVDETVAARLTAELQF